ncbi:undecaprenyl-phosphate mannosyltransferase [bacterium BMS3Abin03]|nr:undecaprenyl-phosphate mannosyltransferase [bacterium BMS3Abin03]HDZ58598.1 glycosyltransferase family 2 protein [Ignavibacteriales bacterium]
MNRSEEKNRVAAIIPFYNECETIGIVINNTLQYVDMVIAVNDGSTDSFEELIPKSGKVKLITLNKNYGKGYALRAGFQKALEEEFTHVVTLDADLQHNPDEIKKLFSSIDKYDLVIGNRLNNLTSMPLSRKISNKLTSFFLTIKTGQQILDSQCGFRAYRTEVLKNIQTKENGYEAETEMILLAAKKGYKIGFAGVSTIYAAEKSKMTPVKTTIGFIKLLLN